MPLRFRLPSECRRRKPHFLTPFGYRYNQQPAQAEHLSRAGAARHHDGRAGSPRSERDDDLRAHGHAEAVGDRSLVGGRTAGPMPFTKSREISPIDPECRCQR
jgi:hypothetical protein